MSDQMIAKDRSSGQEESPPISPELEGGGNSAGLGNRAWVKGRFGFYHLLDRVELSLVDFEQFSVALD
ncbi:hypothetical protein RRG08_052317 [Elysia crispata]|uniref:Uncharacterized protein n=1 Tax=Elysia crispata TaxID=231223 RepID=A0AAE1AI34_9GAST|nr:hypothetical protein RRG08_052317 [Elysia crispata]